MIGDKDLISIQQARILAENAAEAQARLSAMPQETLDAMEKLWRTRPPLRPSRLPS